MKMMRGILKQETAIKDKGKENQEDEGNGVRQQLLSKDHKKNQAQKKEEFLLKKKFL